MRTLSRLLIASMLAAASCAAAQAGVRVTFIEPDQFTDLAGLHENSDAILTEIDSFLVRLGERYLRPYHTLTIDVLDVDLAGRAETPGTRWPNSRIVGNGADWPEFKLRYTLEEKGRVVSSQEATVSGRNVVWESRSSVNGEPLGHEKRVLEEWFRKCFADDDRSGC